MASPLFLELGSIIQIEAPRNSNLHNNIYYIDYIDNDKIKIVGPKNTETLTLSNGSLDDESIENVIILSKPEKKGYARIEELLPSSWIEIHIGGNIPTILLGEITDLIEDSIEIKLYPSNEVIYIDFGYQGIPEDLNIVKIVKRKKPETKEEKEELLEETIEEPEESEEPDEEQEMTIDELENIDEFLPEEKIKEILITGDQLEFGETLEEITQDIDVPDYEKRYDIIIQTNDILDEILAKIPTYKRNRKVLNDIHILIERYTQLRNAFSNFDENGNVISAKVKTSKYKPIVSAFEKMDKKLSWLLPVATYKKKLYNVGSPEEIEEDYNDAVGLYLFEVLKKEEEILEAFSENKFAPGVEKLPHLLNLLNDFQTPYLNSSSVDNILDTVKVNTSLDIVIDNDNFDSTALNNRKLGNCRFNIQNYSPGLKGIQKKQNKNQPSVLYPITPNESAIVTSFLSLPEPFMRYSNMFLPNTSIFEKSLLNLNPLYYFNVLSKSTDVDTQLIEDLDEKVNQSNLLTSIRNVTFSESIEKDNKYKNYLQKIIPSNKKAFNLLKEKLTHITNFEDLVQALQPFLIYYDDLTYKQFQTINEFLENNIDEYKKQLASKREEFNRYLNETFNNKFNFPYLFENVDDALYDSLKNGYSFSSDKFNSEYLKTALIEDNTWLLTSLFAFINKGLVTNINIEREVTEMLKENSESETKQEDTCKSYIVAKKYIDISELEEDNNKTIYYDKKYDYTHYDMLESFPRRNMDDTQYREFVALKLQENIGLPIDVAREDAKSMIEGKKEVKNGDYAELENFENDAFVTRYYKREDDVWVLDEDVTKETFMTGKKTICNSQPECLDVNNTCITAGSSIINEDLQLSKLLTSIDNTFYERKKNFDKFISNTVDKKLERLQEIREIQRQNTFRYDYKKQKLGESVEIEDTVESPHKKLLDAILEQSDFVKKQNDIIAFSNNYVKEGESPYFYYCNLTNLPILPAFLVLLANAFRGGTYFETMQLYIKEHGKLSESGDYWVDEHSGYYICLINLTEEEEYTDQGFKVVTHDIVEENASIRLFGSQKTKLSKENASIMKVVRAMNGFMGISVDSQEEFIMKQVSFELKKNVLSKEDYEKKLEILKKKKITKKLPPYEEVYNNALVKYTLCYLLIAIQSMTPSVKTKKTFPGCVRSFVGYPFYNQTDMSSLQYISCIAAKLRSKYEPWNAIYKEKEEKLFKSLQSIMEKIIPQQEVQDKFQEKQNYLAIYKDRNAIPEDYSLLRWKTFLPPLELIKVGPVKEFSPEFLASLEKHVKENSKQQTSDLFMVLSKINTHLLSMVETIQEVVDKEELLLKTKNNIPFMENACCNVGEKYTLKYFAEKEPSILKHNNQIKKLYQVYLSYTKELLPQTLYDPDDTKLVYPTLSDDFSESTIYLAFLHYCKFNKNIPLPEDLKKVCSKNTSAFQLYDSLDRKIEVLKREGKNYNQSDLKLLLRIIEKQNIISMDLHRTSPSSRTQLNSILLHLESKGETIVPKKLLEKLVDLNDNYDNVAINEDFEPLKNMRDYILEKTSDYKRQIKEFINIHSNDKNVNKKNALTFLNSFGSWNRIEQSFTLSNKDNNNLHKINTLKMMINEISVYFPLFILNNISSIQKNSVPKYWKLSERHTNDIENILKKGKETLTKFYTNEKLRPVLKEFLRISKDMLTLYSYIPFQGEINKKMSLFNSQLNYEFSIYVFTFLCIQLIKLSSKPKISVESKKVMERYSSTNVGDESENIGEISEIEIVSGQELQLNGYVSDYLVSSLLVFKDEKTTMNYNKETIMAKVLRSKEKEKEEVTSYFQKMSDQEREIENLFKRNKLGKWSLGLGKGVVEYAEDVYEQERKAIDERAMLEKKLGAISDVTQANNEIFMFDAELQSLSDEFADNEAYDMSMLPEDDMHGEGLDGDEMFY